MPTGLSSAPVPVAYSLPTQTIVLHLAVSSSMKAEAACSFKCLYQSTELHDTTSHKAVTALFTVSAMRMSHIINTRGTSHYRFFTSPNCEIIYRHTNLLINYKSCGNSNWPEHLYLLQSHSVKTYFKTIPQWINENHEVGQAWKICYNITSNLLQGVLLVPPLRSWSPLSWTPLSVSLLDMELPAVCLASSA
jgi:hypothetical protein